MYSLRAGINPSVARECGSVLRIRSSICTTPFAAASVAVATIAMATERNSATWVMLAADELTDHGQDLGVPERAGANSGRCERYRNRTMSTNLGRRTRRRELRKPARQRRREPGRRVHRLKAARSAQTAGPIKGQPAPGAGEGRSGMCRRARATAGHACLTVTGGDPSGARSRGPIRENQGVPTCARCRSNRGG